MFNKIDNTGALFQAATFEYQALSSATSLKSAMKRFEKSPVGATSDGSAKLSGIFLVGSKLVYSRERTNEKIPLGASPMRPLG
jgi:hypothetical protein